LAPVRARANAAQAQFLEGHNLGGAVLTKPTSLVVESEDLTFHCALNTCDFRATYHVRNSGESREEILGVFYGGQSDQSVKVSVGGVDIRRALSPETLAATDAAVRQIDPTVDAFHSGSSPGFWRTGFDLGVDGGQSLAVVFEGALSPFYLDTGLKPYATTALRARHPWVMPGDWMGVRDRKYKYALSPIRTWAGSPVISVSVVLDPRTSWDTANGGRWRITTENGRAVARLRILSADASTLEFSYHEPGTDDGLHDGGPLLGIGGRLDEWEFRMRAGWEVGWGDYLIGSAVVESNLHSTLTFVPVAEVATRNYLVFFPAMGAGIGLPIQLRLGAPAAVGVRVQGTLSFAILSLVFSFDYFPSESAGAAQFALVGQVSF
jgi:hypothetical protein